MVALLDVNVLIALFDPSHVHHEAVHLWFGQNRQDPWATCPITENAFVRIVSNPAYPGSKTTAEDATARLHEFCAGGRHEFWADSVSLLKPGLVRYMNIQGYRQLTDVYLLALALAHGGKFVTLDSTIAIRAIKGATPENLHVIAV